MSRYDIAGTDPGSWGEFFTALEHMTTRMQSAKFSSYELAASLVAPLQANVITTYNSAMATLNNHTANVYDAHALTREMMQIGLVENLGAATPQQILDGVTEELYITADGFSALATKVLGDFGNVLHHQGINPISVYGDISWMPPDVYGSFEGSGMVGEGNAGSFSLIEDDGTLIGLRAGTNGTSKGLYYYTLSNAEDRIDDVQPFRTNFKYQPANRPAGFECLDTISSDVGVIVGKGFGHATYDAFVALTNGTMDVTKHYVGYFRSQDMFNTASPFDPFTSACVVGNYVYMFIPTVSQGGVGPEFLQPYEVRVYRCPTSQIVAGGGVSWEYIQNWNSTGLWGNTGVSANVRVAPTMMSSNPANKPFVLHENRSYTQTYSPVHSGRRSMCIVNPNNANQVRLMIYHTMWTSLANGTAIMPSITFSILIDLAQKTAAVEDGARYIEHKAPNPNQVSLISPIVMSAPTQHHGYDYGGNFWVNTLVTERGILLCRGTGNQPDEGNRFMRSEITNFVNRFDSLRVRNRTIRPITHIADPLRLGSAFSNNCFNPRLLPGNYLMFNGTANGSYTQFWYGNAKRLQLTGSPTFNYNTLNSGVIKGWAPNSTRMEFPTPISFNQGAFITRMGPGGSVIAEASVAYGPDNGGVSSSGTAIDKDLKITGTFSWNTAEGNNVALVAARMALGRNNVTGYAWTIYACQDTAVPVVMVLSAVSPRDDAEGCHGAMALVELNHTGARSGLLTGYSVNRIVSKTTYDRVPGNLGNQYETNSMLQVFHCADNTYLMSIASPPVLGVYGSQTSRIYYAAVRPGTRTIEDGTVRSFEHSYYPTGPLPSGFVHPSYGLCVMDYGTNQANYSALIVINVVGATYADFLAWQAKEKLVVGAQEVEQGWLVYFTTDTPVFLAGKEYILPATNFDLRDIVANPANKTFYCYVRLGDKGIEYFITAETLAPTMVLMYIGTIRTGTSDITNINITKKIRVDTFELSPTHIGSGIPVGVGVPPSTGDFTGWIIPYIRNDTKLLRFAARLDYEGIFSFNMRTGVGTVSLTANSVNSIARPVTSYTTGTTWDINLQSGTTGDGSGYATRTGRLMGVEVVDVEKASSWSARIDNFVGRDTSRIIITQPSPANDYTVTVSVTDVPGTGVNGQTWDEYEFDLFITVA